MTIESQSEKNIEKPLLSICIPTYNQPGGFEKTLKSIKSQLTDEVEVIVRDDSSDDETKRVAALYACQNLRYFRGIKEGLDKTLIFLLKEARGRFVWWFVDDILADGALKDIVSILKENPDISLMVINSRDLSTGVVTFNFGKNKFFKDKNQVLKEVNDQLGFISGVIFRKEDALPSLDAAYKYIGTSWVNLFIILSVAACGKKFYFIQTPYILSSPKPPGEKRWYDSFQVHAINYFLVLQAFKDEFDRKIFRKALANKFGRSWRAVVVERAMGFTTGFGSKSPKIFKMAKLYWNYPEFYIALPLFLTPRPILKMLYKIYRFFFRRG
jgi:glycosyltransferase involved in cell wall biosynthesis